MDIQLDCIYNCDCLEGMKDIPDGSIDAMEQWIINNEPQFMCVMLILCIVIGACMIFGGIK